ncbi:capsular biosynthesis protein [Colwellia psychrerythraea]|uniref:Capsular biosynthesis protein n=1 Tax=Colwellia psychrerythraea TaxID=28229 RepID=A0A1Y5EF06_COLPS|nr:capsular biosynthesis protein [Colwellia psychrerythraea]
MTTKQLNPNSTEEKLIWFGLTLTYPFFAFGGLYIMGSVLGWLIFAVVLLRWYVNGKDKFSIIPAIVWLWIIGSSFMLLALLIGHSNWDLGLAKTIKSSIGWAKGWALMPLFLFIGAFVDIKPQLVVRAVCIVSCHSLIFAVVTLVLYKAGVHGDLFISPLKVIGGPGETFFTVSLFGLNPETGAGRWRFFTPWAPAAGFMACIFLIFTCQEKDAFWRKTGLLGSFVMCLLSQSRAGWVIYIALTPLCFLYKYFKNPVLLILIGLVIPAIILLGEPLFNWLSNSYADIKASRPHSTRVRNTLEVLALQRWESEAPIWGHGIVEKGPKIVESMPIGSHHSWYGLLFVKGIVGLLALAIPLAFTSIYLFWNSLKSQICYTAALMVVVFICYSFFENLEILSFIYWPALVWIGIALNPLKSGEKYV